MYRMSKIEFDALFEMLARHARERYPDRMSVVRGLPYAINRTDKRIAFVQASYRHTLKPEFTTHVVIPWGPDGVQVWSTDGHPRKKSITAKNGWVIDPEYRADW